MSNIPTPATIEETPIAAHETLEAVRQQMGSVPNLFRLVANSPHVLNALLGMNGALGEGELDAATRERIALAVAEINKCNYCLAAHTYVGASVAKLSDDEIITNRKGGSKDPKADAAVKFAVEIVLARGSVAHDSIKKLQDSGFTNAEIIEIIAHVAYNIFTNYLNIALGTEVDFPAVSALG